MDKLNRTESWLLGELEGGRISTVNKIRGKASGQAISTMLETNTNVAKGKIMFLSCVKCPLGVAKEVDSPKAYKGPENYLDCP